MDPAEISCHVQCGIGADVNRCIGTIAVEQNKRINSCKGWMTAQDLRSERTLERCEPHRAGAIVPQDVLHGTVAESADAVVEQNG